MADYWKSIPRKFCDFCKCWLTDNKPSIEFHERGRKHQNNVQKKIGELRRKGQKMLQEEKNTERMMKQMESNAMKAFSKDIVTNPDLSAKSGNFPIAPAGGFSSYPSFSGPAFSKPTKQNNAKQGKNKNKNKNNNTDKSKEVEVKVWFQGKSEDGNIYYWNCVTGASQWEKPDEGYISMREQEEPETNLISLESLKPQLQIPDALKPEIEANKAPPPQPEPLPPVTFNKNPYGSWIIVSTTRQKPVDLQLPKPDEKVEIDIPEMHDDFKIKFQEKVMPTLSITNKKTEIGFKKRKINTDFKRNIRQKIDEDT